MSKKKTILKGTLGCFGTFVLIVSIFIFVPRARVFFHQVIFWRESRLRRWSLRRLQNLGPVAVPALISALNGSDADFRGDAADILGEFGPEAIAAVEDLGKYAQDKNVEVRLRVIRALGKIGSESAVGALLEALDDENAFVRQESAGALKEMGPKAHEAVPKLAERLAKDDKWEVRELAAEALAAIGPKALSALPALEKALSSDKDEDVRDAAKAAKDTLARGK